MAKSFLEIHEWKIIYSVGRETGLVEQYRKEDEEKEKRGAERYRRDRERRGGVKGGESILSTRELIRFSYQ